MKNVIQVLSIASILITGQAFAQGATGKDALERGQARYKAEHAPKTTNTGIQNVGIEAKVESQDLQFYKVSGKVTYLNNGEPVEHLFKNVTVVYNAKGKFVENSEDGPYETYLYIKTNDKGQTVLFARVYYIPTVPDEIKGTSNGVAVPAPIKESVSNTKRENLFNGPKY